jgi:hypothetical protein
MIHSFKIGSSYEVKLNDKTKDYDYYNNDLIIPTKINKLYKFMSFNNNTIASLLQSYFWLANPASFNDPFDCNKNLIVDYSKGTDDDTIKAQNHFNDIGVTSFVESMNSPLMWAHYANNYNGIVLELDSSKLHLNNIKRNQEYHKTYELRKVIYPDYIAPLQTAFEFAKTVMFTAKLEPWKYEQEWRIISSTADDLRYLMFDPNIVKRIYMGYNLFLNNSTGMHIVTHLHDRIYPNSELFWVYPHQSKFGKLVAKKV